MTASELDPRSVGGMAGQGGSGSSAAPSSPGGAADLDLDAIEARWLQICGHCDVDVLIAEVRALRARCVDLQAEIDRNL